jgi:purine nucleosidase
MAAVLPCLIIDTDLFSDVDDVGALAVAHAFADRGEANFAAIGINTPSRWGHRAARVIGAHYGRAETPIGALLPLDDSLAEIDYARHICDHFPGAASEAEVRPAVSVFREALANAPDNGVTVVSIGFFPNLVALLRSEPDRFSPLKGAELVRRKVREAVVMGGEFPEGKEFNIASFPDEARAFLAEWPVPIVFVGFEVGVDVITGRSFPPGAERNSPVAAAYRRYAGGRGRASWDLIAVSLAVRGTGPYLSLSESGTLSVDQAGANAWMPDPAGSHRYVRRTHDAEQVAADLEALLTEGPRFVQTAAGGMSPRGDVTAAPD